MNKKITVSIVVVGIILVSIGVSAFVKNNLQTGDITNPEVVSSEEIANGTTTPTESGTNSRTEKTEIRIGKLAPSGPSITLWGTHTLTEGDKTYSVRAGTKLVETLIKKYENSFVKITGVVKYEDLEGGFWSIDAKMIEPHGGIEITSPGQGSEWEIGKTYTIKWQVKKEGEYGKTPIRILLHPEYPPCIDEKPACKVTINAPYVIALHIPLSAGSYTWKVSDDLKSDFQGDQFVSIYANDYDLYGHSGPVFIVKVIGGL